MDKLINKKYESYNYISRYASVPYYYDTEKQKEVYGIGEQMLNSTSYVSHKVQAEDTLDSLALNYYGNPTFWWVIAYFNRINDPFVVLKDTFSILKIPAISSTVFKNER